MRINFTWVLLLLIISFLQAEIFPVKAIFEVKIKTVEVYDISIDLNVIRKLFK